MKYLFLLFAISLFTENIHANIEHKHKKRKKPKYDTSASTRISDSVSKKESAIERYHQHPRRRIRLIESNSGVRGPTENRPKY